MPDDLCVLQNGFIIDFSASSHEENACQILCESVTRAAAATDVFSPQIRPLMDMGCVQNPSLSKDMSHVL